MEIPQQKSTKLKQSPFQDGCSWRIEGNIHLSQQTMSLSLILQDLQITDQVVFANCSYLRIILV
ncbi:ANM_collapsed_G0054050.mRNA.1.CDS.1 [Saccharomyces cerevisiae]|nr:ANM_collapsed_G0054050.mRNA.1.CDS.1 [Saccharomyces cerevisiae]